MDTSSLKRPPCLQKWVERKFWRHIFTAPGRESLLAPLSLPPIFPSSRPPYFHFLRDVHFGTIFCTMQSLCKVWQEDLQSLFNLRQRTCQQEAPGGGLFSSITSSLFNLAALIVWNATMLWTQGHKNLHFQLYWLLSRISSFFPWSGNCTLLL